MFDEVPVADSTVKAVPKLYDVIIWLMGRVERFPRSQKFTLGDRIVNVSLNTLDRENLQPTLSTNLFI